MKSFTLSGWKADGNTVILKLRFFTVFIEKSEGLTTLRVVDENGEEISLQFNTLEEAIVFTEKIIFYSRTNEAIKTTYQKMYDKEYENCQAEILNDEQIKDALISYFSYTKGHLVQVRKETKMLGKELCVNYYIQEPDDDLLVTNVGLKYAFTYYLKDKGLEVLSFKQIERSGDKVPYFIGFKVFVKEKNKKLTKEIKIEEQ